MSIALAENLHRRDVVTEGSEALLYVPIQQRRFLVVEMVFPIALLPTQAAVACYLLQVLSAHLSAQECLILMEQEAVKDLVSLAQMLIDTTIEHPISTLVSILLAAQ